MLCVPLWWLACKIISQWLFCEIHGTRLAHIRHLQGLRVQQNDVKEDIFSKWNCFKEEKNLLLIVSRHSEPLGSGPVFCLLLGVSSCYARPITGKVRLCSTNHRAGYFSNLACDWLSIVLAYSKQEKENGPRSERHHICPHYIRKTLNRLACSRHQAYVEGRIYSVSILSNFTPCKWSISLVHKAVI